MDNPTNNLDDSIDQMMFGVDLETVMMQTEGAHEFMQKLAPQEMDRLVAVLTAGLRSGFGKIISEQIADGQKQASIIQEAVTQELKDAAGDMQIKDLEKKFNVGDFSNRVMQSLGK